MPVFYTSYRDDKITKQINDLVGGPYGFFKSIQMGGTGCKRMQVIEHSDSLKQYLNDPLYPSYSSIELRPNGIILSLSHIMQRFSWPIAFHQLKLEIIEVEHLVSYRHIEKLIQGIDIEIADGEHYLKLQDFRADNRSFMEKLQHLHKQP